MKNKKILITGGLGFIGSNLVHECIRFGAKVTVYDCLDPKSGGNMRNVSEVKNKVKIILNDIRNFEGISAAIIDKDIIFNCAAYTSHPQSMTDPLVDIDVNCKGTINLLEAVRRFNPKAKIVHIGTSTQTGRMVYEPIDELHPEFPIDIYSANKCASEKYMIVYHKVHNIDVTVIRLVNTYGSRANIKNSDLGFINYFIGLGLQGKEIPVYGKGGQVRSSIYIEDAVKAIIMVASKKDVSGEVFLASSDEYLSVMDIARSISDNIGGRIKSILWPKNKKAIEIGDAVISNKKIKKILGWKPVYSFEEGLKKTCNYFTERLEYYL